MKDAVAISLLGRNLMDFDIASVDGHYSGRTVVVTGGAGSIGSRVCDALVGLGANVVAVDNHEASLVQLYRSLPVTPVLSDVTRESSFQSIMSDHEPDYVFHAAAWKHVDFLETSAYEAEAVDNNVCGTSVAAQASEDHGAKFVYVSSDKAVDPGSLMGRTKQSGERISAKHGGSIVRFGNVIPSSGNVLDAWSRQLAETGQILITSEDMYRYFMHVREAAQLTIYVGAHGEAGVTYVLDMGRPRRLLDMARAFLMCSGVSTKCYQVVGPRPGEKMCESLHSIREALVSTGHPGIHRVETAPEKVEN